DFKKPIHNVKYGSSRPNHRALARRTVSLHHLDMVGVSPQARAPSVAAKLRLVARFVALAGLDEVCSSLRCFISSSATWWSLSGSNR
ncbi:hypothetical protein, partial [Sphingomonas sp. CFBP 13714]|uniref:hypothetical protein n=1 Tax=Sphingomonas sp. CFBP 13714 TaxID=2775308 RepID=UPI001A7E871B